MTTNNVGNIPTGVLNTVLQGQGIGSNCAFSTATYPSTAGSSGNILTSDGTNWNSKGLSVKITSFTGSGTYTRATGMVYCIIECLGGGGAGGGAATTGMAQFSIGAGGGAGEYARGAFSAATVGASQAVTIGSGGTGVTGTTGNSGGTTSVGALITAVGGNGGATAAAGGSPSANPATGGSGGSGGQFRATGLQGILGQFNANFGFSGAGANSQYGSGGFAIGLSATAAGNGALGSGAGGGGAVNQSNQAGTQPGGNGSSGLVVVTEFVIS